MSVCIKNCLYFFKFLLAPFSIFAVQDAVWRVKDFSKNCDDNTKVEQLATNLPWPNAVQQVPDSVFKGADKWYTVSAGFFPGNKNDGCIALFNENDPKGTETYFTPGCKGGYTFFFII